MAGVRLGVFDEHEIFRRGVLACVGDQPDITAISDPADGPFDLAIMSVTLASTRRWDCPVLLCAAQARLNLDAIPNRVVGVLSRTSITPDQLLGAVRAAAAGLTVMLAMSSHEQREHTALDPRARTVLKMLAAGQDTHQIADDLGFSERTIKHAITLSIRVQRLGNLDREALMHFIAQEVPADALIDVTVDPSLVPRSPLRPARHLIVGHGPGRLQSLPPQATSGPRGSGSKILRRRRSASTRRRAARCGAKSILASERLSIYRLLIDDIRRYI